MTVINLFRVGDRYFFKHYFRDRGVFEELRPYYDSLEYRFEVWEEEMEDLVKKLRFHGFNLKIVEEDQIPDYTVIIDKYVKHKDLLRNAVDVIELGDEKALVMKDMVAKEEALDRGREPDEEWRERL
ncbi:hypothetical protein AKJ43_03780 [candidate division MSBL1 archaeon SCGC-AAA261D19]|uniref:Uncharacterized protein n=3 Tax=candidate division MSBL1 TaxID=215777 RepID=A0A133UYW6_9EURY|nr:hypothetical protein AKJ42_03295 [candidate division MSBL1 archaeon SCGC-AAA261C02]KXB00985.1 hypothetical protein AKJ43_03780 [candidate division MSBL1 archaeon SCGC-AAA261D19]KXB03984.1 hypothetical protein AKJ47_01125 [candidate division MSBL1 archaeon SCGC-AAA261G05]